jgi:hypothetical protein
MKISVNLVKCLLGGFAGLTLSCVGYTILTWQYYVIILPAIIVIIKWVDILFYNYKRKKEIQ